MVPESHSNDDSLYSLSSACSHADVDDPDAPIAAHTQLDEALGNVHATHPAVWSDANCVEFHVLSPHHLPVEGKPRSDSMKSGLSPAAAASPMLLSERLLRGRSFSPELEERRRTLRCLSVWQQAWPPASCLSQRCGWVHTSHAAAGAGAGLGWQQHGRVTRVCPAHLCKAHFLRHMLQAAVSQRLHVFKWVTTCVAVLY